MSPPPQRIVWIYGQWKPLHEEMQRIIPYIHVEFEKGIPVNIEDEQFLIPAIRNLIVIDDLMSEASNDKLVCDLFTKGSQHRNLSVIMSAAKFILPGKRKSHHELKQSVSSVIQKPKGPTTNHGLGKTDVPRSESKVFKFLQDGYLQALCVFSH